VVVDEQADLEAWLASQPTGPPGEPPPDGSGHPPPSGSEPPK
jgi:hypothetical protein